VGYVLECKVALASTIDCRKIDSLFQPEALASIANWIGVELNEHNEEADNITEDEKDQLESEEKEDIFSRKTCYNMI
jgi:hypothetical protein